jgi:V-type H+-transporting ATPase subunit C
LRLCKTNFSEAFAAWVHIKALRIFVESILRYGLPPNFQAAVLKPHKGKQDKLLSTLCQHYQKLGPSFGNGKDDNPIEENLQGLALDKEFFPFVRFELVFEE